MVNIIDLILGTKKILARMRTLRSDFRISHSAEFRLFFKGDASQRRVAACRKSGGCVLVVASAGAEAVEISRQDGLGGGALDAEGGQRGLARIAAMPIPEIGLGAAINDRLARAAAPRS